MDAALGLTVVVVVVVVFVKLNKLQERSQVQAARDRAQGELQHRRSGDYPSSCTWCKNTALARKLFVFERTAESWHAVNMIERLRTCTDAEVAGLARGLTEDGARWRRFCTERCVKEFFAVENVAAVEPFVGCDYCSVRFPLALMKCPNCGAAKRA
jgi:hypothetical protein